MNNLDGLLKTETDQRLLRLFAVSCCRQIWDRLIDERSRTAVEVAERFADGQSTQKELNKANDAVWDAARDAAAYDIAYAVAWSTANVVTWGTARAVAYNVAYKVDHATAQWAAYYAARQRQLELYHCIFTKIVFSTTSQNARNLAKIIYQERQWSLMPILGDALEEAGMAAEVISHCKEEKHARGCWVVDNILGKR